MKRLWLGVDLAGAIELETRLAAPRECCGLVEGVVEADAYRAIRLHPSPNLAGDDRRFEISPQIYIAAAKAARAQGRRLIGCYHSHPAGEAEPSAADLAGAMENDFLWLIAGRGGVLNVFVHQGGAFMPVRLSLDEP